MSATNRSSWIKREKIRSSLSVAGLTWILSQKKEVQMLQGVAKKGTRADQFEKPWSGTSREYPLQRDQRSSTEQEHIIKTTTGEIENATDLTEGGQGSANW